MPINLADVISAVREWRRVVLERTDPSKGDPLPPWYVEQQKEVSPQRDTITPPHWGGLLNACQWQVQCLVKSSEEWGGYSDEQIIVLDDLRDLALNRFGLTPQIVSDRAVAVRLVKELDTFLDAMQPGESSPARTGCDPVRDELRRIWSDLPKHSPRIARFLYDHPGERLSRVDVFEAMKGEIPEVVNSESLKTYFDALAEAGFTTGKAGPGNGTRLTDLGRLVVSLFATATRPH